MTPKRPRDPNQLAKSIIDIATGQKPDRDPTPEEEGKDPAAVAMGKKGGKARADSLTAENPRVGRISVFHPGRRGSICLIRKAGRLCPNAGWRGDRAKASSGPMRAVRPAGN
jgi:hypothetical protein